MDGGIPLSLLAKGLLGSLAAGLATGVGALPVFFRSEWGRKGQVTLLAVAGGVMLGATVFSLILPSLQNFAERGFNSTGAALMGAGGVALGALAIRSLHETIPHEHFIKGADGARVDLGRHWLFVLAIALHNIPEGLSVGVAFGHETSTGLAVTLGIGLQNLPEGLAVAAALIGDGLGRGRAFLFALLTGLVEPLGALIGALAVGLSSTLLPWALAFAAGAMLFVISGEIIPETHREGTEHHATFSLVLGFIMMMVLDASMR